MSGEVIAQLVQALLQLGFLAVVFGALEWCFPRHARQRRLRPQWHTDLAFFFGQLALRALVGDVVPAGARAAFHRQSWLAQALEVVLLGDLLTYWYHRASHRNRWLWAFHRVHHSAPELDWLAAHREHPVDGMLTQAAMNLPAILLGVGLGGLAGLVAFRGLWAAFIHSNVALRVGPLRVLVGAPELHHWHHLSTEHTAHNFSNLAPWTDVVFGTYHCPPRGQPIEVGLPEKPTRSYLDWILRPHR